MTNQKDTPAVTPEMMAKAANQHTGYVTPPEHVSGGGMPPQPTPAARPRVSALDMLNQSWESGRNQQTPPQEMMVHKGIVRLSAGVVSSAVFPGPNGESLPLEVEIRTLLTGEEGRLLKKYKMEFALTAAKHGICGFRIMGSDDEFSPVPGNRLDYFWEALTQPGRQAVNLTYQQLMGNSVEGALSGPFEQD